MRFVDFVAAGQRCGPLAVFLTLMATILGASATLGVAAKAEAIGFPAAWWLASGAAGLALQGAILSARIRESGARTLPELARIVAGPGAQRLVAAVAAKVAELRAGVDSAAPDNSLAPPPAAG